VDPCAESVEAGSDWAGVDLPQGTAAEVAGAFSSSVLGIDGTASSGGTDNGGGCTVVVDHGTVGQADVDLATAGDHLVVTGYRFPAVPEADPGVTLGLQVEGDTVDLNFGGAVCAGCTGRVAVRYGPAEGEGSLDADGHAQVQIARDPADPGSVLITVFGPLGLVVAALGVSTPAGDFAAG
jgi:hypothetical protein